MADVEIPADLLPLHIAALRADRAMTTARESGGDVEAAREHYLAAAAVLERHPFWEDARRAGYRQAVWQRSLDAAKTALDGDD
ncbi:hypothetical protein ACIQOW_03790 [Kitasatospora sp. NPDC091335]|uniref:hypothetical protein n=1 Tax=Kitasatospora sp. NPDC091335 TaxID=3364085 RepID=UPI0038039CB4